MPEYVRIQEIKDDLLVKYSLTSGDIVNILVGYREEHPKGFFFDKDLKANYNHDMLMKAVKTYAKDLVRKEVTTTVAKARRK